MSADAQGTLWLWPSADGGRSGAESVIAKEVGVDPVAARVLIHRGHATPQAVHDFLNDGLGQLPDPFSMKGLPAAVERLARAVAKQERVTLYGDYDVDGVSSTALLASFLGEVGLQVETYIPHRLGEGYGLNVKAIEKLAEGGTQLLVTLDCGITSHAEVSRANALGLEVIVVDHHAVPETMPPALAVLNPLQPGCGYPTKGLCAAGVCFNLVMGLRKVLREQGRFAGKAEPNLKQHLDLVALATVADVVPLTQVNRIFVRHGLDMLTDGRRPGVRALKDVAGVSLERITASHVGFRLGPRINAAGRLDDASVGLRLLLAKTFEAALPLARALDTANAERQQIERAVLDGAVEQAGEAVLRGAKGLVLAQDGWHPGVVGIVASRVVERFHRPTVLVGIYEGMGRGSARSVEGFHLYDALKTCAGHLAKFGGHKAAAGLSVEPERIAALRAAFEDVCAQRLTPDQLRARCRIDAEVRPLELTEAAVTSLEALQPFGMGNPTPVLGLKGLRASARVLDNKSPGEPGHLKLTLDEAPALDVIGFRLAEDAPLVEGPFDLACQVGLDEFRGVKRVGLKVKTLRASP